MCGGFIAAIQVQVLECQINVKQYPPINLSFQHNQRTFSDQTFYDSIGFIWFFFFFFFECETWHRNSGNFLWFLLFFLFFKFFGFSELGKGSRWKIVFFFFDFFSADYEPYQITFLMLGNTKRVTYIQGRHAYAHRIDQY